MSAKSTRPLIQNDILDQDRLMKAVRRRTLVQKIDFQSIMWFYQHLWDYFEAQFESCPKLDDFLKCKEKALKLNSILREHLQKICEEARVDGCVGEIKLDLIDQPAFKALLESKSEETDLEEDQQ